MTAVPASAVPGDGRIALTDTEFASAVTAITSAFGDPTRRQIYLWAREQNEPLTATEVATEFELHTNVARHHLDKLAAGGYLEVDTAPRSGAGRPSKRYRVAADRTPFDMAVRHDDVIIALLGSALAELGPERATELAHSVGHSYGRAMAAPLGDPTNGQKSVRAALHAVADALTAHGFAAHAEQSGDEYQIVSEHCPFGETVIEHPVICAVDRGMVEGMLSAIYRETPVDLHASKPMGDDNCITSITG